MKKSFSMLLAFISLLSFLSISAYAVEYEYIWPTSVHTLSRGFASHNNKAIDISVGTGTRVVASRSGTIVAVYTGCVNHGGMNGAKCEKKSCKPSAGIYYGSGDSYGFCNNGFGNGVTIQHDDGTYAHYAHMNTVANLKVNQRVSQGQELGTSGDSGYCTGPCLHFELRSKESQWKGTPINPELVLEKGTVVNQQTIQVYNTSDITKTTAKVSASCSYTGTRPSSVGLYLGTSEAHMSERGSDSINHYQNPFGIWYNLKDLLPGTTYYYKFYATVNGNKTWSDTRSFTTLPDTSVKATVSLNRTSLTMKDTECIQLTATTSPANQAVTWSSSDSSVATVVGGSVTALKKGTATITASLASDSSVKAQCVVSVTESTAVNPQIVLNRTSLTMKATECIQLTATTTPANQTVTWRSGNSSIATVTGGSVTALKAGTVLIMASMSYEGKTYETSCQVTVQSTPGTVNLSHKGASGITQTTARVDASCSYTGTRPSSVGLYLGTSTSNMSSRGSDTINHNQNPFDIWYNLSDLSANTTYYYQFYAVVNGQTVWSDTKSFKTDSTPAPATTPTSTVNLTHKGASSITQTTARVDASCSYTGTHPSSVGLYLGTSTSNMSSRGSDTINHNQNPFDIWYNLSGLSAGTTYYYRFYAVVNGEIMWSDTKSFKTDSTPAPATTPTSTVNLTHKGASSITQTTARVDASCSYTGTHPSSVGIFVGTSTSDMSSRGVDLINHNQNPFDIWYNLSGLSAGTTYYYRFYAVVNGNAVWSDTKSFTTSPATQSATRTGVVTGTNGSYLAINDKPAASPANSTQIGRIPPGGQVTVYTDKTSGNWYWVEYGGVQGYVYKTYITLQ